MTERKRAELTRAIYETEQARRQWTVKLDGEPVPRLALLELSSRYGRLRYGWTARDHDGWSIRETGSGGVLSMPFALSDTAPALRGGASGAETLLVGVVEEFRPNQGGKVLNVPRGYVDPGERHELAAGRELEEETGLRHEGAMFELDGVPVNANSAFFETENAGEGTRMFALELPGDWLVRAGDDRWQLSPARRAQAAAASERERAKEAIGELVFLPWHVAAGLGDKFTVAAVARLAATLHRHGRWR